MSLKDLFARPDRNAELRKAAQETNPAAYAALIAYRPLGDWAEPMHDNGQHLLDGLGIFEPDKVPGRVFAQNLDATRFDHSSASTFILQAHCSMAMGCVQAALDDLTPAEDAPLKRSVMDRLVTLYPRTPKYPQAKICDDPVGLGIQMTDYILNHTEFADKLTGPDWAYLIKQAAHHSPRTGGTQLLSVVLGAFDNRTTLPNPQLDGYHAQLVDSLREALSASTENGDHNTARHSVHLIDQIIEKGAVTVTPEYIDRRPTESFNTLSAVRDDTLSLLLKRCGSQHLTEGQKLDLIDHVLTGEVQLPATYPGKEGTAYSAALSALLDQQPKLFTPDHVRLALDKGQWGCAEQIAFRAPSITPSAAYGLMMDVLIDYATPKTPSTPLVQALINNGAHKTGHGQTLLDIARHRQLDGCTKVIAEKVEAPAVIRHLPRPVIGF